MSELDSISTDLKTTETRQNKVVTPPSVPENCFQEFLNCMEKCSTIDNFFRRWACGLDCEVELLACLRRKLLATTPATMQETTLSLKDSIESLSVLCNFIVDNQCQRNINDFMDMVTESNVSTGWNCCKNK